MAPCPPGGKPATGALRADPSVRWSGFTEVHVDAAAQFDVPLGDGGVAFLLVAGLVGPLRIWDMVCEGSGRRAPSTL